MIVKLAILGSAGGIVLKAISFCEEAPSDIVMAISASK